MGGECGVCFKYKCPLVTQSRMHEAMCIARDSDENNINLCVCACAHLWVVCMHAGEGLRLSRALSRTCASVCHVCCICMIWYVCTYIAYGVDLGPSIQKHRSHTFVT